MVFFGSSDDPVQLPYNCRMKLFKEILHNNIVSVNSKSVLSKVIGSDADEISTFCYFLNQLHCSRNLNHCTYSRFFNLRISLFG